MSEIRIPELIILLFLLLPLLRPLFKPLWSLEGLIWLPLLGAVFTLGLYPAYGFRPESVPLLIFAVLLSVLHIPAMVSSAGSRHDDRFRDRGIVFTLSGLVVLAAAGAAALVFCPQIPPVPDAGADTAEIRVPGGRVYFLRTYRPSGGAGPLVFLVPPEGGSVSAVDGICAGLRDRGFTVVTYSRRGFDSQAAGLVDSQAGLVYWRAGAGGQNRFVSPFLLWKRWTAFRGGFKSKTANDRGRALEAARQEDIESLLPYVTRDRKAGPLVLIGYGAGGAALVYLAGSPAFAPWAASVKGIIAVEPGLWRVYRAGERSFRKAPENAGALRRAWTGIQNRFIGIAPLRISGFEPPPRPAVPVLYLVSDRAWDQRPGKNRYGAVYETLRNSPGPGALVSLDGAGPLDYTDYPLSHPVYSALFPGLGKRVRKGAALTDAAVAVMANFAAGLPGPEPAAETAGPDQYRGPSAVPASGAGIGVHLRFETRSWNLPDLRYILAP
jgi:dienelactone hydrolase